MADETDRRRTNAAKWAIGAGIGSAAILGGLLYASRQRKPQPAAKPVRPPEDLPDTNFPEAPQVAPPKPV